MKKNRFVKIPRDFEDGHDKFVFSDEGKELLKQMNESQLDLVCGILADNIMETKLKILREMIDKE